MCAVMLGPTVGAWPRTRTLAVQHQEPSGPSPPPLRSPLRPSLFRRPRTLSTEAPVHVPEVLCLYVILALLEIYNHFRQSSPSSADVRVPVYWGLTVEAAQGLCAGGKWSVSNP